MPLIALPTNRRRFCALGGSCALLAATKAMGQSAAWPTKPVRLVVGMAPGGLADVLARTVQTPLAQALGQPVVIDNRGGGGGNVAGAEVVHNGSDGHSFAFGPATVFPHVKAGKLKVLAVASRKRSPIAPDVPTVVESGAGEVFADSMFAVYASNATPAAGIDRLGAELNKILAQPAIKARFAEQGAEALPLQSAELKALVQTESRLFTEIVKSRGITVE